MLLGQSLDTVWAGRHTRLERMQLNGFLAPIHIVSAVAWACSRNGLLDVGVTAITGGNALRDVT